ncbi:hypothetical protein [Streptomyces sp. NPDC001530]|uniref:hypothetical protein n=1 Tax=Streptomyces sp. NPDC001530 TaxID=3364582 RepID=UPI0036BA7107
MLKSFAQVCRLSGTSLLKRGNVVSEPQRDQSDKGAWRFSITTSSDGQASEPEVFRDPEAEPWTEDKRRHLLDLLFGPLPEARRHVD